MNTLKKVANIFKNTRKHGTGIVNMEAVLTLGLLRETKESEDLRLMVFVPGGLGQLIAINYIGGDQYEIRALHQNPLSETELTVKGSFLVAIETYTPEPPKPVNPIVKAAATILKAPARPASVQKMDVHQIGDTLIAVLEYINTYQLTFNQVATQADIAARFTEVPDVSYFLLRLEQEGAVVQSRLLYAITAEGLDRLTAHANRPAAVVLDPGKIAKAQSDSEYIRGKFAEAGTGWLGDVLVDGKHVGYLGEITF